MQLASAAAGFAFRLSGYASMPGQVPTPNPGPVSQVPQAVAPVPEHNFAMAMERMQRNDRQRAGREAWVHSGRVTSKRLQQALNQRLQYKLSPEQWADAQMLDDTRFMWSRPGYLESEPNWDMRGNPPIKAHNVYRTSPTLRGPVAEWRQS